MPEPEETPESIGPYRILDVLGEGGMGTVYLAEQRKPVRRRVALKVIKLGMDSKQVVARFEAERQALAMMEHGNIARIFDCGLTSAGRPYFAMEYVKGRPITKFCDDQKLSIRDRLDLFVQVCEGVQHAHNKGVIHRDLTPNNVLVSLQDGNRKVKIIDFGLARATDHRLTEATIFTEQGQIIGTPEYMSPEQAGLSDLDIDTRTDVYTLGVLLYELLTSEVPFGREELRRAGLLEIQRVIREEEPQRPSTRVTTKSGSSADTAEIAARRCTDLRTLAKSLRGDLDWIVMRALEKEPTRRYGTASELAADVSRHLDNEPVKTRPPSLTYWVHRRLRRHRTAAVVGVVAVLALLVGLFFSPLIENLTWTTPPNARDVGRETKEVDRGKSETGTANQAPADLAPRLYVPNLPDPNVRAMVTLLRNPARAELSSSCVRCHVHSKDPHGTELVTCVDCHGGDGSAETKDGAHPQSKSRTSQRDTANPARPFEPSLSEDPDWIKFVNPGDLRVADQTCGICHPNHVLHVAKSIMSTSAGSTRKTLYASGISSDKVGSLGESYSLMGIPQILEVNSSVTPLESAEFRRLNRLDSIHNAPSPSGTGQALAMGVIRAASASNLNFMGSGSGDFRSSGCSACHVVYANDGNPVHSGPWAKYGNAGKGNASTPPWQSNPWRNPTEPDPNIPRDEAGHPVLHRFTTAIPSSQCLACHASQPASELNTFFGFQKWTYETNEQHTQFADFRNRGLFRAVLKTDRKGNLLDKNGDIVPYDTEGKFQGMLPSGEDPVDIGDFKTRSGRPVHLKDIHAERGMHCVDCHFSQDVHGDGHIYAEARAVVQIRCQDCHGTVEERATLKLSGPTAVRAFASERRNMTPWRKPRMEGKGGVIIQRSMLYPDLEWVVPQIVDSLNPADNDYNPKAAYAKLQRNSTGDLAHDVKSIKCSACHTSWTSAVHGSHRLHPHDDKTQRRRTSFYPHVARDDTFMLGVSSKFGNDAIATVRPSSPILVSPTDPDPTVAANGMSGMSFAAHFPHTVRTTETRGCSDCHVSERNDNNAWLAQTYLMGTNYMNFFGSHAYVGSSDKGVQGVQWTETSEPQAVIGSDLHAENYRESFESHETANKQLTANQLGSGEVRDIVRRGKFLFAASGPGGLQVYEPANSAGSIRSELQVRMTFATAVALPTSMPISMARESLPANREQIHFYNHQAHNLHESYRYAYVTDRREGLILVGVKGLSDDDPESDKLWRARTFNPDGILTGAENLTVAGTTVYVCSARELVTVDITDPLAPKVTAIVSSPEIVKPTSIEVQFRYAFVTDAEGLKVLDVTLPANPRLVKGASILLDDARSVYVARTYAYVAGGEQGLVIVDVENPEKPKMVQTFDAGGRIGDLHDVKVGMAYDSVYGLLADGRNGFHVVQLVTPKDGGRSAYGFAPEPRPALIASCKSAGPARAVAEGMDRDRAVDESGHQVAVFGGLGSRPFTLEEMRALYLMRGEVVRYPDTPPPGWKPR